MVRVFCVTIIVTVYRDIECLVLNPGSVVSQLEDEGWQVVLMSLRWLMWFEPEQGDQVITEVKDLHQWCIKHVHGSTHVAR